LVAIPDFSGSGGGLPEIENSGIATKETRA
jgi:hypothetical protein